MPIDYGLASKYNAQLNELTGETYLTDFRCFICLDKITDPAEQLQECYLDNPENCYVTVVPLDTKYSARRYHISKLFLMATADQWDPPECKKFFQKESSGDHVAFTDYLEPLCRNAFIRHYGNQIIIQEEKQI